jgi:FlaA1/EpsC-like NDP-sugar epimerase
MTRFIISLQDGVKLVYWTIKNSFGGEIIVPRIPSLRIIDLAKVVSPKSKYKVIGARPGEKLHEDLISSNESRNTLIYQNKYIIFDPLNEKIKKFYTKKGGRKVKENFKYDSFTNKDFLLKKQIEKIVFNFIKNFN